MLIKNKNGTYTESIELNAGHAMIMPHKPEKIQMSQINDKIEAAPQDIQQFGLFDNATPNYATYYPDVTEEDLNPKDSEFIEPIFRMLSNVTVHAQWNPINFPEAVLKKSMYKLIGQTVNIDHEMAVGNAIGSVKSVEWQKAYTSNGIKVPSGINATLKIDGKSNPRIARGIMMDPPSIHSNSVTVNFAWAKSHPKMDDDEFFSKLGSFDDKGKFVQKVATDILGYHETSLVSHGADPFAQKVKEDGKIVNPSYAHDRYPLSAIQEDIHSFTWDWKSPEIFNEEVIKNSYIEKSNNNNENKENMKDLLKFIAVLFTLEADSLTEENYKKILGDIDYKGLKILADKSKEPVKILELEGVEAIENEIKGLRTFKEGVPKDLDAKISLAETGQEAIDALKADTKRLYALTIEEGKEDINILSLIENSEYKILKSLHKQYDEATESMFNHTCNGCGSHDITRASVDPGSEGGQGGDTVKTDDEVMEHFTNVNSIELPSSLSDPSQQ